MIDQSVWTSGGFAERVMVADERLKTAPATLTDADIDAMDKYHGNAAQARRARDAARMEAHTVTRPAASGVRIAKTPNVDAVSTDGAFDHDKFMKWANANKGRAVPVTLWAAFFSIQHEQFHALIKEIKTLKAENCNLKEFAIASEMRVKSMEANTTTRGVGNVRWAGVYEPAATYHSGELVTRSGLWLCTATSTSATPGSDPSAWTLIVHRKLVPRTDER